MAETNMYKVVVTGGAGFIGSHLVDALIKKGHEVIVVDDLSGGRIENINKKAKFIEKNVMDDLSEVGEADYIFHLAAVPRVPYSVEHPLETHLTNVDGTLNVLDYARRIKAKKVIFASSSSVYGDQELPLKEDATRKPVSPYALHKTIGEQYMDLYDELYELPTVSLRFFNVYGPRCDPNSEYSLVIGKFIKMKNEGKKLTIYGDGEQSRDFTYVSDIVNGLMDAMKKDVHHEIINLCNGKNITINKIAELIGGDKEYLPPRIGDVLHTLGDNSKAKYLLGWKPVIDIGEGIKKLWK